MGTAFLASFGLFRGRYAFLEQVRRPKRALTLARVLSTGVFLLQCLVVAPAEAQGVEAQGADVQSSDKNPVGAAEDTTVGGTEHSAAAEPAATDADGTSGSDADPVVTSGGGLFEQATAFDSNATESDSSSSPASYELSGYVRGDAFMGKIPHYRQGYLQAAYGELSLQLRAGKSEYGDAFAETRLRYGMQGTEPGYEAELREGYVNAYLGPLDIRLGQQIIVWGKADGFNPTNNLTPTNWSIRSPHDDDRRVGNIAARVFWNANPLRLEGVWVPLYRAVQLPPYEQPKFVVEGDTTYPRPEFLRGTWAGKVHLNLESVDLSASYLYGYAPLPGFTLQRLTVGADAPEPEIRISRTAYNHHVIGFDFATTLGERLGLRGEVAYRKPLHYERKVEAPRPDLQYVVGFDTNVGTVGLIAQYLGRYTFDWQKDGPDAPGDPEQLRTASYGQAEPEVRTALEGTNQMLFQQLAQLQHLVSLRVAWTAMHDALSLSLLGLVNVTTKEWAALPKLGYMITDNMVWSLGGEVYAGPDGTLFGLIDSSLSAGYTELKVTF